MIRAVMYVYDLTVVMHPKLDPKDDKGRDTILRQFLAEAYDAIKEVTTVGKQDLSYEINKQKEGVYVQVKLDGNAMKVGDLEKRMRLSDTVLRFLLKRMVV